MFDLLCRVLSHYLREDSHCLLVGSRWVRTNLTKVTAAESSLCLASVSTAVELNVTLNLIFCNKFPNNFSPSVISSLSHFGVVCTLTRSCISFSYFPFMLHCTHILRKNKQIYARALSHTHIHKYLCVRVFARTCLRARENSPDYFLDITQYTNSVETHCIWISGITDSVTISIWFQGYWKICL